MVTRILVGFEVMTYQDSVKAIKIFRRKKIAVEYIIFWSFQGRRRSRFDGLSLKGSPGITRKYNECNYRVHT